MSGAVRGHATFPGNQNYWTRRGRGQPRFRYLRKKYEVFEGGRAIRLFNAMCASCGLLTASPTGKQWSHNYSRSRSATLTSGVHYFTSVFGMK